MYKFHITGYAGQVRNDYNYNSDKPIDATIYANTAAEAVDKVETVYGEYLSTVYRRITVEECRGLMELHVKE